MNPFTLHTGIVAPLDRMNVDTDAIIPKQFLKRIERTGFGQFLFYELRFDQSGNPKEDFILNQKPYKDASILIARANFGCGSSREHAPWALTDYGFKVIIAPSFADIFYNNCFNNGILPIVLTNEQVDRLFDQCLNNQDYKLQVDLENQIITDNNSTIHFEIDAFRKEKLLKGLDDISLTLELSHQIKAFEMKHQIFS